MKDSRDVLLVVAIKYTLELMALTTTTPNGIFVYVADSSEAALVRLELRLNKIPSPEEDMVDLNTVPEIPVAVVLV